MSLLPWKLAPRDPDERAEYLTVKVLNQAEKRAWRGETPPFYFSLGRAPRGIDGEEWLQRIMSQADGAFQETESTLQVSPRLTNDASHTNVAPIGEPIEMVVDRHLQLVVVSATRP